MEIISVCSRITGAVDVILLCSHASPYDGHEGEVGRSVSGAYDSNLQCCHVQSR